jgi:1-phosphofructokinase
LAGLSVDPFVITLTMTPAVDLTIQVNTLLPGALHRVPSMRQDPGGKGINVAKALTAFHVPVVSTGLLGGERGHWIADQLRKMGINQDFVFVNEETRLNVKITEQDGRLSEFNALSPSVQAVEWQQIEARLSKANSGQWVALCGRLPEGLDQTGYQKAIVNAKQRGVKTLLDSSGQGFREGIKAGPDLVKPNRDELSAWYGQPLVTEEQLVIGANALLAHGVSYVVVSLGKEGVLGVTKDSIYRVTVPKTEAVSTVGAGDSLVAGLLLGFYQQYPFAEILRLGAAAGTAAVSTPGTQQPSYEAVKTTALSIEVSTKVNHVNLGSGRN